MRHELRLIEAIVFAATEPVAEEILAARLPEDADVDGLLAELAGEYRERGIHLVRVGGGWTFRTAEDLAGHLRLERTVMRKPSRAAIETLAVVAYHQPATRSEVEEIRGVAASRGTFDVLLEAGWIRPVGRRNTPGRPVTWGTTPAFLEHFGLASLADLPGIDELKAAGLLDARPASVVVGLAEQAAHADGHDDDPAGNDDDGEESGEEAGGPEADFTPDIGVEAVGAPPRAAASHP